MVIINGTIKVESNEELANLKGALIRRAQRSRKDAGNIDYVFAQSLEDPLEIRIIEKWQSEELLQAHLEIPDDEFNGVITKAKLASAVVVASEIATERVMLKR